MTKSTKAHIFFINNYDCGLATKGLYLIGEPRNGRPWSKMESGIG